MTDRKQYKPRKAARMMRAMSVTVTHKSTCKCLSCATVARTVYIRPIGV